MRARDLTALEFDQVRHALAAFACSSAGKEACLALTPSADRVTVEHELDATWQCCRVIDEHGNLPLTEFPDIRPALRTAAHEGFTLDGKSLVAIRTVLGVAQRVRAFLKKSASAYPALAELPAGLLPQRDLEMSLARALDENGAVTDDASDELAEVRRMLRHLRDKLTRRLEDLVAQPIMADVLTDRYVTIRNNRFVVPVRIAAAAQFDGVVQDRSVSGETAFIEPLFAVALNNQLLMAAKEEEALVGRILGDLTALVREAHDAIAAMFLALVKIDALAARGRLAQRYRCVRPQLDDDELMIRAARQPVLLFAGRELVPIDLLLPRGKRVLIVTGPNTGGKTVALKTAGLLALMTQSGLLIPAAEGSRLPCFQGIYADVGDEQSIERSLSTFSAHVTNLTEIIEQHRQPALVLLDEPGVGTDPDDGAALGIGMIQTLAASGARVALSTHYTPIKVFALADERCVTAAVEFDVDAMAPRYRLIYHSIGDSLALPIARRLGLSEAVLQVAERARTEPARALAAAVSRLEASRRGYEERMAEADERARRAADAQQEAERLLAELREKRRQRWVHELSAAREFVHEVRTRGRELLVAIERGAADRRALGAWVQEQEAAIARETAAAAEPRAPIGPPQIGDLVEVGDTGVRGELLAVDGERAWIQRGSLRFEVPAAQLRRLDGPPRSAVEVRLAVSAPEETPHEVNLLGLRTKEAVAQLVDFLDRAVRAGYPSVRIIHGIGSGALKRAVHEYLSASPYCPRYRTAEPREGGAGVTVAELAAR